MTTTTVLDTIEAQTRMAMAKVSKARGWDTQRERDEQLAFIDSLLDSYNAGQ